MILIHRRRRTLRRLNHDGICKDYTRTRHPNSLHPRDNRWQDCPQLSMVSHAGQDRSDDDDATSLLTIRVVFVVPISFLVTLDVFLPQLFVFLLDDKHANVCV